jgi:ABC-type uncharacterized transport system permease subunit
MGNTARALTTLVPLLYVVTVIDYFIFFLRDHSFAGRTLGPALKVTLAAHVLYLVSFTLAHNHFPLATVFEVMTTLSLAIALVYFCVEINTGTKTTGPFILLLAFVFQLISSSFIALKSEISPLLTNYVLITHSGFIILGYSALAVAFVYGLLYLMLYHQIKSHHWGLVYRRLPALEDLFDMCRLSLLLGFAFVTLGLATGIFWSSQLFPGTWFFDIKLIVGILTWIIYGLCLLVMRLGWETKKVVYFSVVGFTITVFSLLAVNVLFPSFHVFM